MVKLILVVLVLYLACEASCKPAYLWIGRPMVQIDSIDIPTEHHQSHSSEVESAESRRTKRDTVGLHTSHSSEVLTSEEIRRKKQYEEERNRAFPNWNQHHDSHSSEVQEPPNPNHHHESHSSEELLDHLTHDQYLRALSNGEQASRAHASVPLHRPKRDLSQQHQVYHGSHSSEAHGEAKPVHRPLANPDDEIEIQERIRVKRMDLCYLFKIPACGNKQTDKSNGRLHSNGRKLW